MWGYGVDPPSDTLGFKSLGTQPGIRGSAAWRPYARPDPFPSLICDMCSRPAPGSPPASASAGLRRFKADLLRDQDRQRAACRAGRVTASPRPLPHRQKGLVLHDQAGSAIPAENPQNSPQRAGQMRSPVPGTDCGDEIRPLRSTRSMTCPLHGPGNPNRCCSDPVHAVPARPRFIYLVDTHDRCRPQPFIAPRVPGHARN